MENKRKQRMYFGFEVVSQFQVSAGLRFRALVEAFSMDEQVLFFVLFLGDSKGDRHHPDFVLSFYRNTENKICEVHLKIYQVNQELRWS